MKKDFEYHPIAECWTLLEGKDYQDMCESIRTLGLLEPITLYQDKVLDGRNRLRACLSVGVEPRFKTYEGANPIGFAKAANDTRRHDSETQRAITAALLANLSLGANQHSEGRPGDRSTISQPEAAKLMNVSERALRRAKRVLDSGQKDVIESMKKDQITPWVADKMIREREELSETPRKLGPNPLEDWVKQVNVFADCADYDPTTERMFLKATPEQRVELIKSLERLVSVTKQQIMRLKKEASERLQLQ